MDLPPGAVRQPDGSVIIPGTRRPDGTYRKDVRIRAGFTPQEEQPVYVSQGKEFAERRKAGGIPGASFEPESQTTASSKSAKKRARKREKKKEKDVEEVESGVDAISLGYEFVEAPAPLPEAEAGASASQSEQVPTDKDVEKKIRKLKKLLRSIEGLEEKDPVTLNEEQQRKIEKKPQLLEELNMLWKMD